MDDNFRTNVTNIYALGNVSSEVTETAPGLSVKSGIALAKILKTGRRFELDKHKYIPHCIYTPIPYSKP